MLSGIITVILLLLFLAGCVWAWSPRRKRDFDAAARLPLSGDAQDRASGPEHEADVRQKPDPRSAATGDEP